MGHDAPPQDAEPRRIALAAGPVRLAALEWGDPAAPPLVVLHGHADLAWSLAPLSAALAGRFHVVALDLRGHGDSDHPGAYSVLHLVADLLAACDALGFERPVIVAHSLGGHVAAEFASLYPERAEALVLVEGLGPPSPMAAPGTDGHLDFTRNVVELLRSPLRHKPLADVAAAARRLTEAHPRLDPAWARQLAELGTRPGPDGGLIWKFDPRTRDWIAGLDHNEDEAVWARVRCPVLVVDGGDSWETWWGARLGLSGQPRERMSEEAWSAKVHAFPDVAHVVIEGAGHMVHFDQPAALEAAVLAFLDERVPPPG